MNFVLFDDPVARVDLLPFTFTRPVAAIRVGMLTLAEKWRKIANATISYQTEEYLTGKFPKHTTGDNFFVNGAAVPDEQLVASIGKLKLGETLMQGGRMLAMRTADDNIHPDAITSFLPYDNALLIDKTWKIFQQNGAQLRADFLLLTKNRKSEALTDPHTRVYNQSNIFLEEGVSVRAAILNADNGPIYLSRDSQIHEGAIIRGPFFLGEGSHVNMGAKVRGDTTVGPHSKIGGEVSNTVIFGYSNKAHDGFLGNSVIGEWCNFGADSNTSNLKNNFENVKVWSYATNRFADTGLQFCGLVMGDHSKCGINTMFNTGTVVGVAANIFGAGFPRTFIPSFSWGGAAGYVTFKPEKVFEMAAKSMVRRNVAFTGEDAKILKEVFARTSQYRSWDKV